MKRALISLALVLLTTLALPAYSTNWQPGIVASLYVFGTIDVSPQGNVTGYTLQESGRLPPFVIKLLKKAIPAWHFKPTVVDGHPAAVKTSMTIRLLAQTKDQKSFTVSIDSTSFGDPDPPGYDLSLKGSFVAVYPRIRGGQHGVVQANATAYVRVRVNRQGKVTKSAVEEVDIGTWGDKYQLQEWRRRFGRSALNAARSWQFNVPTKGKLAGMNSWDVIVSVEFRYGDMNALYPNYGLWYTYTPGPFHPVSWADDTGMPSDNMTPPARKGVYVVGAGLQRIEKPASKS